MSAPPQSYSDSRTRNELWSLDMDLSLIKYLCVDTARIYRVSTKKVPLTLEDQSTHFKIVVGIKVRGDSESAGEELSELSLTCILTIILKGVL